MTTNCFFMVNNFVICFMLFFGKQDLYKKCYARIVYTKYSFYSMFALRFVGVV